VGHFPKCFFFLYTVFEMEGRAAKPIHNVADNEYRYDSQKTQNRRGHHTQPFSPRQPVPSFASPDFYFLIEFGGRLMRGLESGITGEQSLAELARLSLNRRQFIRVNVSVPPLDAFSKLFKTQSHSATKIWAKAVKVGHLFKNDGLLIPVKLRVPGIAGCLEAYDS